jgi:hypothetical protein
MGLASESGAGARDPLALVRAFCFPGGEDAARRVRAVRLTERGEIRSAPGARWMAFTAEEEIEAARTRFRWEARFGGGRLGFFRVTDAYEDGHGQLAIRVGGIVPVKKVAGPDADKGELQRYLASFPSCPAMILNNPSLEWSATGPLTFRVRDVADPAGAAVEIEIDERGCPLGARAERPMLVGNQAVPTPWLASGGDYRERDGLRIGMRMEASWRLPGGPFMYYRAEVTSFRLVT